MFEFSEVVVAVGFVTCAGRFLPLTYHAFGPIYLLMVVMLSLRVGRWPVMAAALLSAIAWNFVFMPPRMSFSVLDVDDALMLGTYFTAALIGGLLTTRIHEQEKDERQRERRATALFHLTRELAAVRTLDETARTALREADDLFQARTALLLLSSDGQLKPHPLSSLKLRESDLEVARSTLHHARPNGRFMDDRSTADYTYLPMVRAEQVLGVFVLSLPADIARLTPVQRDLIHGFGAQIAMLVEREQLCAARESEKLLAESERLHRTLLDCVSHELKTPLAVLRAAGEKIDTPDADRRANLTEEIRQATQRLDHLVANLLNQTRLESGRLKPELDWCEVQDVLGAARRAVGRELAGRPITIDIAADMPLFMADAVLLEQVVSNVLLNAALHTPAGTAITLSAGRDRLTERVFISISDQGSGIAAGVLPLLFQKFFRGASRPAGGLGLGLSIVRGFTLAQGGEVVVSRSKAGGACFTIYLPHLDHSRVPDDEL
ncbi:MAG TPA: ATP-binding protein [Lacunisphaera sp.]